MTDYTALSIMNIEAKVLNMIEFDDVLKVFVDKKRRESSAQLNHLFDIMGILYKYLIAPWLFNICMFKKTCFLFLHFFIVSLDFVYSSLSYCLLFF